MGMWERSERSEKEGKYSILKDITGCSEKTVRCDEAQRKCCIFTVYWEKVLTKCTDFWGQFCGMLSF